MNSQVAVVIPNWNGRDSIGDCLDSLLAQTLKHHVIVVDNGSVDGSVDLIKQNYPSVEIIEHARNKGFAGGVNAGILRAQEIGSEYVALFNNDARAHNEWLKELVETLANRADAGIATCKFLNDAGDKYDSTGDNYTTWGLPYPRSRDDRVTETTYNTVEEIFSATGGASLYRIKMLEEIGLFDEDFFAYYEDVDLSFRAQLAGWKVLYVPTAVAYHQIGATSGKIKGFTTYQTMKNLPLLLIKNVPARLLPTVFPRFVLTYLMFIPAAIKRRQISIALRGFGRMLVLLPKKLIGRRRIQKNKKVTDEYIKSLLVYDLPPQAVRLRKIRSSWRRIICRRMVL
jgi:GT2 family glycosyltransferase